MKRISMLRPDTEARAPHQIAADWLLREEAGQMSAADRARLDAWLEASADHRAAWADVHLAVVTASDHAAHPELMAMRSAALAARSEPRRHAPLQGAAAAAAVLVVILGAGWLSTRGTQREPGAPANPAQAPNPELYRTAVGERAAVTLPDGSVATLDTDSILKVAYTDAERGVRLLRGQALFDVAKHKPVPFQVYAGDERITAVGTKFDVRVYGQGAHPKVSVALVEGVVRVSAAQPKDRWAPRESLTMAPGEMLTATPAAPLRVVAADTELATSWRSGVLIFDDMPLDQAVAEMNRYSTLKIAAPDPKLSHLHLSGVFKTGDPEHFVETIAEALPVQVTRTDEGSPKLSAKK